MILCFDSSGALCMNLAKLDTQDQENARQEWCVRSAALKSVTQIRPGLGLGHDLLD